MNTAHPKDGINLELITAAYFQAHGYLVRRGVVLSVGSGTSDATDIDLLAIRFNLPLSEERLIVDCKDRKKSKPYERILWTLGLASFSHANRSIIVLPQSPWQAREFANKGGVEVLEANFIREFLNSKKSSFIPFGDADSKLLTRFLNEKQKESLGTDKEVIRQELRIKQMLVLKEHPLTILNRIILILSSINKKASQSSANSAWLSRYVCFNAAIVASIMLTRFVCEVKWTPEPEWLDYAKKKLTYGDVPPKKAQQLAQLALERDFFDGLPEPQYVEEILELLKHLIHQPNIAAFIPFAIDFLLFGAILSDIPDNCLASILGHQQEDVFKLGKRVLSTLAYAAEVPVSIWTRNGI